MFLRDAGGKGEQIAALGHADDVHPGLVVAVFAGTPQAANDLEPRFLEFGGPLPDPLFECQVLVMRLEVDAHPLQHDRRMAGFVQVIDRPQAQTDLLVVHVAVRGQEDHRNPARTQVALESATGLVAVHSGHHHVEQDQVRLRRLLREVQRLQPVARKDHAIVVAQNVRQQGNVLGRVIDDENRLVLQSVHGSLLRLPKTHGHTFQNLNRLLEIEPRDRVGKRRDRPGRHSGGTQHFDHIRQPSCGDGVIADQ